jgi:hypothetical protein
MRNKRWFACGPAMWHAHLLLISSESLCLALAGSCSLSLLSVGPAGPQCSANLLLSS